MGCYCFLRNVQDFFWDGKTPFERRCGEPLRGTVIPCGSIVEHHSISAKDQSRLQQFGEKVLLGIILDYALYAGCIWKGDIMVADSEELENLDASEMHARRLNAKEVLMQKMLNFSYARSQMDQSKLSWRDHFSGDAPQTRITQHVEKSTTMFFEAESDACHPSDTLTDDGEARNDFSGRSLGIVCICRHLYRKENHSHVHCDFLTWSG